MFLSCPHTVHFEFHVDLFQAEEVAYLSVKDENHVLTLTVWNLEPKTQYLLQIQSENKFGKSKNTLDVFAMTSGEYLDE